MFVTTEQGFVFRAISGATAGPRCAVLADGRVLCSFMAQSKLGVNDFVPMIAESRDLGRTWSVARPVWPELRGRYSLFCSISGSRSGELFLYGSRTRIDAPGESFWSDATQGLKANDLFIARSQDGDRWTEPASFPLPEPGAAECPGALCVTRSGRWVCCYSPYNTFDRDVRVTRDRVVAMLSDDCGLTWRGRRMMDFENPDDGAAEAWVVELADGRLIGACWHMNVRAGSDYENAFVISNDVGETWSPVVSTGIRGQSVALAPLPDRRVLMVYNPRKVDPRGVWLAVASTAAADFGLQANRIVWRAENSTQSGTSGEHATWTDFAFGEPSVTLLLDGSLLLVFWCAQPSGSGIGFARVTMESSSMVD